MRRVLAALAFFVSVAAGDSAEALLCVPILGCSCTVTASDIEFGAFAPNTGSQDATGQIAIDCAGVIDVAPVVQTRLGTGQWGNYAMRKMRSSGGELLDYNIYTTSQHNVVWGDGTGASSVVNVSGGLLSLGRWTATRTMFAQAAPTPLTKPGAYGDIVVVRIVW